MIMSVMKQFNYSEGNQVRLLTKDGEPWFVAVDVCNILGLSNPSESLKALDSDERSTLRISEGGPESNIISESGLYSLVIRSNKPEAKQFKRWITHEVIPSIRKHGTYMTPETIEKVLLNPDTIIQIATQLKEEQTKRIAAEAQIEKDKPKVLFADSVSVSNTCILVRDLAKLIKQNGYDIGEVRLFKWLRENDYLIKNGTSRNTPTQKAMDLGLFKVKETVINKPDGDVIISKTPLCTGKGQMYFINKFIQVKGA